MMSREPQDSVERLLRALARDMEEHQPAPPALEARLRSLYRAHRHRSRWRKPLWFAVIPASVAVLAVVGAVRWLRPAPQAAPPVIAVAPAPKPEAPVAASAPPLPEEPPRRVRRARPPADHRPSEIVTGFLPVAGGDWLEPPGRGRLVRVRLPREALWTYGLPMNVDRSAEAVTADVLLGEDGLARAIRFVQPVGQPPGRRGTP